MDGLMKAAALKRNTHLAPSKAPIRVPIESRETMRPSRVMLKWHIDASVALEQVAKRRRKSSMRRISEIWPVSY